MYEVGEWRTPLSWVSYFNFSKEVKKFLKPASKVVLHDVTLRDGEQTPGIVFRQNEKVEIASKLDEVGVHRIEAGFPAVSEEDKLAVKKIVSLGIRAKVFALARLKKDDIDLALDCDVDGVVCEGSTSDIHLKYRLNVSREEIIKRAVESVDYAKAHGLYASFMSVDSTRTDLKYLIRVIKTLTKNTKVDSIVITDSYCAQHPLAFMVFVKKIKKMCNVPLEVHCHNELGLAVANTLMGISQGAQVAHVSVNGLGEKTGNAALEETAVALKLLFGIETGIVYEKLYELSQLVQKLSGFKVSLNKPVVGDYAFARESGLVVYGLLKFPLSVQSYNPELVGNTTKIILGKKSGKESLKHKLKELGVALNDEKTLEKILIDVKKLSISKKGAVEDEELLDILRKVSC
ncbi:MAG: hypothetical protein QXH32_03140 [Candidatus Caldarchaeum sp.]